jgi:hypothetical protein
MTSVSATLPLTKLPPNIDLTLYLIREELKIQKFFRALHKAGIDDIYLQPHLGKAILMTMDLDDGKDETYEFYYRLVEKRSKKIGMEKELITKQALKVYEELVERGRRMRDD